MVVDDGQHRAGCRNATTACLDETADRRTGGFAILTRACAPRSSSASPRPSTSTSATAARPPGGSSGRGCTRRASTSSSRPTAGGRSSRPGGGRRRTRPTGKASRTPARDLAARLKGDRYLRRAEDSPEETVADRLTREAIWRWVTPRWRSHLETLVERERPDAVVVFTVPMAHFRGIPTALRERFGVPVVFYDGDVPMSLPEFGGMDTGFNYYHGADPGEYDLVVSNSEGGLERLLELGARRAEAVFWARRSRVLRTAGGREGGRRLLLRLRRQVPARVDGGDGRRAVARRCRTSTSRSAAATSRATSGNARLIGDVPFNVFPRAISAARVNLCITRRSHATRLRVVVLPPLRARRGGRGDRRQPLRGDRALVRARLASCVVVDDADEAVAAYRELLDDPGAGRGDGPAGARARARRAHLPRTARGGCWSSSACGWQRMSTELAGRARRRRSAQLADAAAHRDRAGATTRS